LKGKFPAIKENILKYKPSQIKIPSIVKAELLLGAEKFVQRKNNLEIVYSFLENFEITSFGEKEAEIYSEIRAELEKKGKLIGPNDLLIASSVIRDNAILITNNLKEFKRVNRLRLENWCSDK
jgi:tRNA(fMet)-specific endonuclease VapC